MAAAIPSLSFTLHTPAVEDVAEGDDEMDSLFPHTPRHHASWFEAEPAAELIEQCLRPGHCGLPDDETREWLHRRLAQLGHAFNDAGNHLMAHTWFESAYAANATVVDLISAANMRLKLGQWALVEQLYKQIMRMELNDGQREVAERKLAEVTALKEGSAPHPGCSRPTSADSAMELASLLDAAPVVAATLPADAQHLLQLVRSCGFAANAAGDFEAAQNWFDCAFATSGALSDLLSAANMRVKLSAVNPTAEAAYKHALTVADAADKVCDMAQKKLATLSASKSARQPTAAVDEGHITYRTNA
eukprot:CAMPEP_0115851200 /NCGR_PEP_ID=MMETSP0287-20121206/12359_1 /TAXON_ID=412157 /ORGANISM="Chrysochromulina rotalis, Strain UIO044" /LENGTH=303 /DNA_ID=CAMNT_0003305225 /DNA_START=18 /DNA_END=929 /DNA_ORIENTATION=+